MNSIRDIVGRPALILAGAKLTSPGIPFIKIRVEEEPNSPLIMSRQIFPKPKCLITSRRKDQDTGSKGQICCCDYTQKLSN
jgi:hypothetical protein